MPKSPDEKFMSAALRLATKAEGMTSPNPVVGAVVVRCGVVIGKGYHKKAGLPHAEIEAFSDAEKRGRGLKGSTLYVTLEPCCHTGKRTPPCADAIIEKGISKVVVGTLDLNPKVNGKGVAILREKGVEVSVGVLEEQCREANEVFFKYITTGTPFIVLKLAATLDGKIAAFTGDSKWIGSEAQRKRAHELRNKADAVLVGINTVIQDDPELTVRLVKKPARQPAPVVLDSELRIPLDARLLRVHESPIVVTTLDADAGKINELRESGARVIISDADESGRIDLVKLVKKLGEMRITSVLIEGGSRIAASFLMKGLVDKVVFFYAPKIVGAEGISMIGETRISKIGDAIRIKEIKIKAIGEELIVEGYIKK